MAIFHLTVKTVARASGRSAVAAAAYRSGVRLVNERDGLAHDFRARSGVVTTFIAAPDEAPAWMLDRQALWSAAEMRETRLNAVTAREWEAALPAELDGDQRETLARHFAASLVKRFGIVTDCAIHAPSGDGDRRNHHLHMLTTTRTVAGDGFGAKTRALDDRKSGAVDEMRELWERLANDALQAARLTVRIDRRTLKAQAADAQLAAACAAQEAEKAARSLNPIGKRRRVQRATQSAQEAAQKAEALLRAPTTHAGPERTALRRKVEASNKRAVKIVDFLVATANRMKVGPLSWASSAYETEVKKAFDQAAAFLDDMFSGRGAILWAKDFMRRGGSVARVFGARLKDERLNPQGLEGDRLAEHVAYHVAQSDERATIIAWSAAAALYEAPRLEAQDRVDQERLMEEVEKRLQKQVRDILPSLERRAMQYFKQKRAKNPEFEKAREQTKRELRRDLNDVFGRIWPDKIQAEFDRVTAADLLEPPAPAPKPPLPEPLEPEPEKPVPPPIYRGPSGPSM